MIECGNYRPFKQVKHNCKTCANLIETGVNSQGNEYFKCTIEGNNRYPYVADGIVCACYREKECENNGENKC